MIEGLTLIEGQNVSEEALRSVSLMNAKQLVVGSIPGKFILHVNANSPADFGNAVLAFAQVPGVTEVLPLRLQIQP